VCFSTALEAALSLCTISGTVNTTSPNLQTPEPSSWS
jgi:hypothetical protein